MEPQYEINEGPDFFQICESLNYVCASPRSLKSYPREHAVRFNFKVEISGTMRDRFLEVVVDGLEATISVTSLYIRGWVADSDCESFKGKRISISYIPEKQRGGFVLDNKSD